MTNRIRTINMTPCTHLFLAGMIALSGAAACPALADVYYVTYTGTASGTDTYGAFGTAGATLSNVAFTSTYSYDPSQFGNATVMSTSNSQRVYGGTFHGDTTPFLSAAITINGNTFSQGSSYNGLLTVQGQTFSPYMNAYAYSSDSSYIDNYGFVSGSTVVSFTALQSFAFLSTQGGDFVYNGEDISLTDTYVTVTDGPPPPATVPEPTSLALLSGMAAGFGLAVGGLRAVTRRRLGVDVGSEVT